MKEYIQTSEGDKEWPPTYRQKMPSDYLLESIARVREERARTKEVEKIDWKLLIGLHQPL